MIKNKSTYFALSFYKDKYIIGICNDKWFWFYNCFIYGVENINKIDLSFTKLLFVNYIDSEENLDGMIYLDPEKVIQPPENGIKSETEVFFDENESIFKTQTGELVRPSTFQESLFFVDIFLSKKIYSIDKLKLRILEMYYGFVPSFYYQLEHTYESFFEPYKRAIDHLDETFTTKERKKEFDRIFNERIIPFVKKYGFERHTKTSKRLFRKFENGLSCFMFFEHKSFAYGSYEVSVFYFDEDIGNYLDDMYLARIAPNFPYSTNLMIDSQNKELLNFEVDYWIRLMELYMFPFIAKNTSHKDVLKTIENKSSIDKIRNELGIDKMAWEPIYYFDLPYSYSEKEEIWSKNKKYINLLKDKSNIKNSSFGG